MGKKSRKAKQRKVPSATVRFLRPTEHREAHNDFEDAGAARRVTPVIDTLRRIGKLNQSEYDALAYYREQAHKAEDDMAQSSPLAPARIMGGVVSGGGGGRIPVGVLLATPAICETARIERDLGALLGLARAIAVDDFTLTRWCIKQSGGIEKFRKGEFVAMEPRDSKAVALATMELRMAAHRIVR